MIASQWALSDPLLLLTFRRAVSISTSIQHRSIISGYRVEHSTALPSKMSWFQGFLAAVIVCVAAQLFLPVYGYSCTYVTCDDNEYCCGEETCCFNFGSIWYAWVLIVCFIISCCVCCICRQQRRSSGQIIVRNPIVPQRQTTAVVVSTQQQVTHNIQPHPGQYGAFGAAQAQQNYPQYPNYNQQKFPGQPPMYQAAGYYGGNVEAPPAYTNVPSQQAAPPYQQVPEKVPSAPQWN